MGLGDVEEEKEEEVGRKRRRKRGRNDAWESKGIKKGKIIKNNPPFTTFLRSAEAPSLVKTFFDAMVF